VGSIRHCNRSPFAAIAGAALYGRAASRTTRNLNPNSGPVYSACNIGVALFAGLSCICECPIFAPRSRRERIAPWETCLFWSDHRPDARSISTRLGVGLGAERRNVRVHRCGFHHRTGRQDRGSLCLPRLAAHIMREQKRGQLRHAPLHLGEITGPAGSRIAG
jgi:hypothetical protein